MNSIQTISAISAISLLALAGTGCSTLVQAPDGPALSTASRAQIGVLAVRSVDAAQVDLTDDLGTRAEAAGASAMGAGAGWLGATMAAAGESGDPLAFSLIATFGLVTTPVAMLGGAAYGAAAADSPEQVALGNQRIQQQLAFAPEHLRNTVVTALAASSPVPVLDAAPAQPDALQRLGANALLEVALEQVSTVPDANNMHVRLGIHGTTTLTDLDDGTRLALRPFSADLGVRAVSQWAANDGAALAAALDAAFQDIAQALANEYFSAPAIRVAGIAPLSPSPWRSTEVASLQPQLHWQAIDGDTPLAAGAPVDYEVRVSHRGSAVVDGVRTAALHCRLPRVLEACQRYRWQVRAHYTDFAEPVATDWTPEYRFRTPCDTD